MSKSFMNYLNKKTIEDVEVKLTARRYWCAVISTYRWPTA